MHEIYKIAFRFSYGFIDSFQCVLLQIVHWQCNGSTPMVHIGATFVYEQHFIVIGFQLIPFKLQTVWNMAEQDFAIIVLSILCCQSAILKSQT